MSGSEYDRAVIRSVLPGLISLADELRRDLIVRTHRDTGELKSNVFASVDDSNGEVEFGYDESTSEKPHGFYYIFGNSRYAGDPAIQDVAYKNRRQR